MNWASRWLTRLAKVVRGLLRGLGALRVGPIAGLMLVSGARSLAPGKTPATLPESTRSARLRIGIAATAGVLAGVFVLFIGACSPAAVRDRQEHRTCVASNHELIEAKRLLSERRFVNAEAWADRALRTSSSCHFGQGRDAAEGEAYATSGIAKVYQHKPDFEKDLFLAETLLERCSAEKSRDAESCRATLDHVEIFINLGYCNRALTDVATARSTSKRDPARAEFLAQRALRYNSHCKNAYAYAINAAAHLELITTRELEGKHDVDYAAAVRSVKPQLERCVHESVTDINPGDMQQFCRKMLEVATEHLRSSTKAQ